MYLSLEVGILLPLPQRLWAGGRALWALRVPNQPGRLHESVLVLVPQLPTTALTHGVRVSGYVARDRSSRVLLVLAL